MIGKAVVIYLIAINLFAFILFGMDKRKAQNNAWRISEKGLFLSAILGGSVGAILGMHLFHHKTKHWYFRYGLPLILLIQVALVWVIWCIVCGA